MQSVETIRSVQQFLTFRLAQETYAIDVLKVREILDVPDVTKVPQAPAYMLGVINLRGSVVPVVDLRKRFQVEARAQTKESCIVVVEVAFEGESLTIGIVGDSVEEVVELTQDQIEPPPKLGTQLNTEFILGMGKQGDDFILLLDIDKIFASHELEEVVGVGEPA